MRLPRPARLLALAVLPIALTATPASAVSCPLLTDLAGDAYWLTKDVGWLGVPRPNFPNVDILSADVASGPTSVVAVIRVASLDHNSFSNLSPEWIVAWTIGSNRYAAYLRPLGFNGLDGPYVSTFTVNDDGLGSVPFAVDRANGTVTWTIPRTRIPELASPGATFEHFGAITNLMSSTADTVHDLTTTYVDQSSGCISAP